MQSELQQLWRALKKSRREVFFKKGVLKNFTKFSGKYLCWSLFFNKVAGLSFSWALAFNWNLLAIHRDNIRLVFSRFLNLRVYLGSRFLNLPVYLGIVKEKPTRKTCFSRKKKRLAPRIYQAKFCLSAFFLKSTGSLLYFHEKQMVKRGRVFEKV